MGWLGRRCRSDAGTSFETWSYHSGLPINPYAVPAIFELRVEGNAVTGVHGPIEGYVKGPWPSVLYEYFDLPYRTSPDWLDLFDDVRNGRTSDPFWQRDLVCDREQTLRMQLDRERRAHRGTVRNIALLVGVALFLAVFAGGWHPW